MTLTSRSYKEFLASHKEMLMTDKLEKLLEDDAEEDLKSNEEPETVGLRKLVLCDFLAKIDSSCQLIQENYQQVELNIKLSWAVKKSLRCCGEMLENLRKAATQPTLEHFFKKVFSKPASPYKSQMSTINCTDHPPLQLEQPQNEPIYYLPPAFDQSLHHQSIRYLPFHLQYLHKFPECIQHRLLSTLPHYPIFAMRHP